MDNIKEAFQKVKSDIFFLKEEIDSMKSGFSEIKNEISELKKIINLKLTQEEIERTPTQIINFSTIPTHLSTHDKGLKPLKHQIYPFSIGNEGVPTDKQTNRQTDKQTNFHSKINENSIDNAAEMLNSLDNIKKEIRLKFKRLTDQEFFVFSTLYQLEEEFGYSDYKTISKKLNLTESSIRDYIGRLIKKGIPIDKNKVNNKTIQLKISSNLKKIATLSTILTLRDL